MRLTKLNYYSQAANREYMSVSQFKSFLTCEAATMAELNGEYERPASTALLVGSYVDSWFEGTLDEFKSEHPEIFKRDGTLKADYVKAEELITRAQQSPLFMDFMGGEKQKIIFGEIDGVKWKGKIDSYHPGRMIVDLKTSRSLHPVMGKNLIEQFRYDIQGAIYQRLEGHNLPFYLAILTKEDPVDIEICEIEQPELNEAFDFVKREQPHIIDVKTGKVPPKRCGVCPYCRLTKQLDHPIPASELGLSYYELQAIKGGF